MVELKPAYLIHGEDHGAIAERRAGLRGLAEEEQGAAGVEVLEGDAATPPAVAGALSALTLAIGRRVIIVEGVERWREADVSRHLAPAMSQMPPDTTLALFAREEARAKAPAAVHEAVRRAGGQIVAQMTVKPWELARWVREQAARMGLSLDAGAAQALVAQVGERQQRLLRELEKIALERDSPEAAGEGTGELAPAARSVAVQDVEARAARSAQWRAYALADALVAASPGEALRLYVRLREQGERASGLTYVMAQRLRDGLAIALRLHGGEPAATIKRGLRMPARAAERLIADAARSDPDRLRGALCALADLELDSRGGAPIRAARTGLAGLSEDTLATRAIEAITR
jgi:DNA polymerase III subunit delta